MKSYRPYLFVLLCLLLAKTCCAGTLVVFHIYLSLYDPLGEIDVALYDQDKPITVNNFINLVEGGAYENGFFHRLVPGFVLQGGGFYTFDPYSSDIFAPPYGNVGSTPNFGNIADEIFVGPFHSNVHGTIAMAKSGAPGTANSQFFFNLVDNPGLDAITNAGGYTVFGQVVRGTNILNEFNTLQLNNGIADMTNIYGPSGLSVFSSVPSYPTGTNAPPYDYLAYYTINILSAQIQLTTNGARQISWNSISGVTNNVEYTTNLPPVWQVLANPVGTGYYTNVIDASSNNTRRFYRIHVLY